ncbi:MAG TPA: GMC family oxidoreductase [Steroidobacteraceae bacterium]|nr:GMC family oxidoreductase [Steroidobacteraceae bacterium]
MAQIELNDAGAVVIIGSGAGGGTLAHELTRRGIKVVLLEAGKRQSPATFSQVPGEAFGQLTWLDPRTQSGTWGVVRDFPTLPVWICKTVGGSTVHWTAATPRVRPWEIRNRSTYGEVSGTSLIDWPISYDELKTWYRLAERRMNVTRRNGNPGMPANNNFKVMYAAAKKVGYKRVHTNHMAINTRAADGRGFCIQQGFCVQGCKTGAKWSTLYTEIPRAEATGNLDLRTECMATRIEHGADGLVNAVIYRDSQGAEQRQKARVVCVAGNSIETARLLLLSESARYPQGLANSAGQVGRNYCHHITGFVWGLFDKPVRAWRGAVLAGIVEDETVNDPRRGFFGGYHLEVIALDLPSWPLAGLPYGWGRDFASIVENYQNAAGMFVCGEDMGRSDNRITLDPKVKDAFGLPVAHVHVDEHDNDKAMRAHGHAQAEKMYLAIGAKRVVHGGTPPATHNMCTARMSANPRDGVTNAHGQTHDIRNLFVSDGSAFSSPGSANPTLTIVALALRQGDYLSKQMMAKNL